MTDALPTGSSAPTVLRIILGKRLKELREAAGIRLDAAAKALSVNHLTIRRMENAQVGLKVPYVKELLRFYDVGEAEVAEFIAMAERANAPGWWYPFRDALPDWFRAYVSLENDAEVIRVYEPHYVTGLLQTRDYARAVIGAGFPHEPEESLEQRVDLRLRRQELLERDDAPTLWVVLEEAALRREVGGPAVMRGQLDRLAEAVELPNVTLRIVPLAAGPHPGTGGHVTYFRFRERELQDIVYTEVGLTSAVYLDQRPDVVTHLEALTRVSLLAADHVPDPRTYLGNLRKEFDR
ncbi:XRE family transcriptional regulator [Streptomyces abyssalis]|uniref:XRE family transcriptional regulator n=1 Tax=Streptomyces abyssalis TaxID=933944 RepID=A0A1E7JMU4_9ACTN|nr:helix-turn-helix transcriptional regulator [Streptomyces abyssalis]OEU87027.1 XRE family transcriptional regulator [Streptomyces abyssalis]OEU89588.1 XRE family transcriptional regulator [Streptomyces abyssalis]OEV31943.1 XRE family transcriptional regulator [Streptomyces nanshensis]